MKKHCQNTLMISINNKNQLVKIDTIIIVLFSVFYLFLFLGTRHLTLPDEGRYPQAAWQMLYTHNGITPLINGVPFLDKPILYYWLEALSILGFGVQTWAIRLPQALMGLLGIVLTYYFGQRFYERRVGLFAACILASSPLYFLGTHYADMDLEVGNLLWISALLFLLGLQYAYPSTKRRTLLYSAYIVAALAFLTKGLIGLALPALVVAIWIAVLNRWVILKKIYLGSGLLIFVLIVSPWLIAVQMQNPDFLYYFFYYEQIGRFLGQNHFHSRADVWFYVVVILIGMLPWSFYFLANLKKAFLLMTKNRFKDPITLYFLIWVCTIFIFFSIPATKLLGYIMPILGPLAILFGKVAHSIAKKNVMKANYRCILLGLGCLFFLGIAIWLFPLVQHRFSSEALTVHFFIIGLICTLGSIIGFSQLQRKKIVAVIMTTTFTMLLFNIATLLVIPYFDIKTSAPLLKKIKLFIKPYSVIVGYQFYQQDLPLLLQKNIYIVDDWHSPATAKFDNWQRELYIGIRQYERAHKKWPKWYIDQKTFLMMWQHHPELLVFIRNDDYRNIASQLKPHAKTIAQYKKIRVIIPLFNNLQPSREKDEIIERNFAK